MENENRDADTEYTIEGAGDFACSDVSSNRFSLQGSNIGTDPNDFNDFNLDWSDVATDGCSQDLDLSALEAEEPYERIGCFQLLALPSELRIRIYEFALSNHEQPICQIRYSMTDQRRGGIRVPTPKVDTDIDVNIQLLLVCRQIYKEALEVLYSNCFSARAYIVRPEMDRFFNDTMLWADTATIAYTQIRNLRIDLVALDYNYMDQAQIPWKSLRPRLQMMHSVKKVQVTAYCYPGDPIATAKSQEYADRCKIELLRILPPGVEVFSDL